MENLATRLLGYISAPFVGEKYDGSGYTGTDFSGADDLREENEIPAIDFGAPSPQQMVPYERLDVPGDTISNRAYGTHTLIPGRALSAQFRMKNFVYELPSDVWTQNPEGPAYIVRVPGLPNTQLNLMNVNNFTTQPEFLQPITNLEIQNTIHWMDSFRAAIFGQAQQQVQSNSQEMFPSIFGGSLSANLTGMGSE